MIVHPVTRPSKAWQNTGGAIPSWLAHCCFRRDGEMIHERRSGRQVVNLGETLVRDLDGEVIFYTPEEYKRAFVPQQAGGEK
jgi:hypothetical protein